MRDFGPNANLLWLSSIMVKKTNKEKKKQRKAQKPHILWWHLIFWEGEKSLVTSRFYQEEHYICNYLDFELILN